MYVGSTDPDLMTMPSINPTINIFISGESYGAMNQQQWKFQKATFSGWRFFLKGPIGFFFPNSNLEYCEEEKNKSHILNHYSRE